MELKRREDDLRRRESALQTREADLQRREKELVALARQERVVSSVNQLEQGVTAMQMYV